MSSLGGERGPDRWVVLGLAPARAEWFRDMARWSDSARRMATASGSTVWGQQPGAVAANQLAESPDWAAATSSWSESSATRITAVWMHGESETDAPLAVYLCSGWALGRAFRASMSSRSRP